MQNSFKDLLSEALFDSGLTDDLSFQDDIQSPPTTRNPQYVVQQQPTYQNNIRQPVSIKYIGPFHKILQ